MRRQNSEPYLKALTCEKQANASKRDEAAELRALLEGVEVTNADGLSQLQVGLQAVLEALLLKLRPLWDLTQQQAHQDEPFLNGHSEAIRCCGRLQSPFW